MPEKKEIDFSKIIGKRISVKPKPHQHRVVKRVREIIGAQRKKVLETMGKEGFDFATVEKALASGQPVWAQTPKHKTKPSFERVPTGIFGLDDLIEGGFEKGSTILLIGNAGTGKSTFGLQFLYYGATKYNEPGVYITFEESGESLKKHTKPYGWNFEELERKKMFQILEYKPHQVNKLMQEGGGPIRDTIKAMKAKRLVIDSITAYTLLFRDEYQKRESVLEFFDLVKKWGCTSIVISELPPKLAELSEGSIGFLTDAIISLYYAKEEKKGVRIHSCEILKMRGTRHTNKVLAIGFERDGLVIYPDVEVF